MKIEIQKQQSVIILLIGLTALVLFIARSILTPFLLAAAFAYLLNPVVKVLQRTTKLPRPASIAIIYTILIGSLIFLVFTVWSRYAEEAFQFNQEARSFLYQAESQVENMPVWLRPLAADLLNSGRSFLLLAPRRLISMLPGAINGGVSILIFLVAMFYFLKDGEAMVESFFGLFPNNLKTEVKEVIRKVNAVLGNYLRGQLLLITIMSTITLIALNFIGVRYSLLLSLFTGVAETIPFIGPIVAAVLAMLIAYTDNFSRWGLDPVTQVILVGVTYTVLRQIEDLFVIPQVMGRLTKLHPLVILFSALLGGHLFGIIGFIIAVPVAASLRVVFEHSMEYLNKK